MRRGRFKGKRIRFAPVDRTGEFDAFANEFMGEIFDLLPGEYLITDESTLRDFTEFDSPDTTPIWRSITEAYSIGRQDVPSERLVDLFMEIRNRLNLQ